MANEARIWFVMNIVVIMVSILSPQVPCFFILAIHWPIMANTNLLPTSARVNYQPYGIDFPGGPTGRFCNGRTTVDILVSQSCVRGEPKVPCFFIFGDSLADNGNNNRLRTPARANYEPYGIDFPQGPTGRFTNGRTTVDFIAEFLGFEDPIPCYANTKGFKNMVRGLNYASASAGVRDETGSHMGENVNLNKQLLNHKSTVKRITSIMGLKRLSRQHLQKCLYSVGLGSNDYLMNYFQPKFYPTSKRYTPEQYASVLIKQYSKQMKTLYKYGARKVVLNGVGQVGCTPSSISITNGSTCAENMNNAVQFFNQKLKSLVDQLNTKLTDAKFIYVDMFGISGSPSEVTAAGIKVTKANCCPVDEFGQCVRSKATCQNRSEYAFWDLFHPTEASNLIIARKSYNSSNSSDTYPANIRHLVQLRL